MKYKMNYDTPFTIKQSGRDAFKCGDTINDCPVSERTQANAILWWEDGWKEQESRTCKGRNCSAVDGICHSDECIKDHDAIICHD